MTNLTINQPKRRSHRQPLVVVIAFCALLGAAVFAFPPAHSARREQARDVTHARAVARQSATVANLPRQDADSGPIARYGNRGQSITEDPTIPKKGERPSARTQVYERHSLEPVHHLPHA